MIGQGTRALLEIARRGFSERDHPLVHLILEVACEVHKHVQRREHKLHEFTFPYKGYTRLEGSSPLIFFEDPLEVGLGDHGNALLLDRLEPLDALHLGQPEDDAPETLLHEALGGVGQPFASNYQEPK